MSRLDEIVKLRKTGLTYAKIGRRFGITAERVRQILKGNQRTQKKPDLSSRAMLTTGDAAKLLGVHISTARKWAKLGMLESYRIGPRGDRRFKREDIDVFLSGGKNG